MEFVALHPRCATILALLLAGLPPCLWGQPGEEILSYHSSIVVREDGSLVVTETIAVQSLGKKIRRGIYRDFPTLYSGPSFTRVAVPFRLHRVARNGQPEPFHTENLPAGIRIYIGREDRILDRGEHTYEIEYETDRQLGFFQDHDELYWNVTGSQWDFPIREASAAVVLPPAVSPREIRPEGYTGPEGASGRSYRSSVDPVSGEVRFSTTQALAAGEGLTIVVAFPKGYVTEPTNDEKWARFREANPELLVAAVAMAALLLYYFLAWLLVGRDPEKGPIFPRASPPMDLPPACLRYLSRMGFDQKCFTVALIDMAVKGHLRIDEVGGTYELARLENRGRDLSTGEKAVASHLLSSGRIRLSQSNRKQLKKAILALKTVLRAQYEGTHFRANREWLIPGMILSVLSLGIFPLLGGGELAVVGFMTVWLTIWTFGVSWLVLGAVAAWRAVFRQGSGWMTTGRLLGSILLTLFALPFLGGEVFGLLMLARASSLWIIPQLLLVVAVNLFFFEWLKSPTRTGQTLMDQIEGFRKYLSSSRVEVTPTGDPSRRTVELFEENLPYALALDVENEWADQFQEVLAEAFRERGDGNSHPWYHGEGLGSWQAANWSALGTSLGSAISSSTSAPGSSSGSGGGGSSGGGGGGGGGGGW